MNVGNEGRVSSRYTVKFSEDLKNWTSSVSSFFGKPLQFFLGKSDPGYAERTALKMTWSDRWNMTFHPKSYSGQQVAKLNQEVVNATIAFEKIGKIDNIPIDKKTLIESLGAHYAAQASVHAGLAQTAQITGKFREAVRHAKHAEYFAKQAQTLNEKLSTGQAMKAEAHAEFDAINSNFNAAAIEKLAARGNQMRITTEAFNNLVRSLVKEARAIINDSNRESIYQFLAEKSPESLQQIKTAFDQKVEDLTLKKSQIDRGVTQLTRDACDLREMVIEVIRENQNLVEKNNFDALKTKVANQLKNTWEISGAFTAEQKIHLEELRNATASNGFFAAIKRSEEAKKGEQKNIEIDIKFFTKELAAVKAKLTTLAT